MLGHLRCVAQRKVRVRIALVVADGRGLQVSQTPPTAPAHIFTVWWRRMAAPSDCLVSLVGHCDRYLQKRCVRLGVRSFDCHLVHVVAVRIRRLFVVGRTVEGKYARVADGEGAAVGSCQVPGDRSILLVRGSVGGQRVRAVLLVDDAVAPRDVGRLVDVRTTVTVTAW